MPKVATENNKSTGADGYPGSMPIGPFTSKTKFGGYRLSWRGVTVYNDHPSVVTHHGLRTIKPPSQQPTPSTFFFEGNPIAFVGDFLQDNDTISPNDASGNPVDATSIG
jgi:hypothetical protein